ncbi:MAG: hypothetical protein EZS28_028525 [Streblomastix strix]|uniref:MD-2-related lipid-recognition domain-containing protein n=1 Tax=Streblomastix strix TaxID=222440 RepID=A0A5J4UZK8_9EUKA|nr:MAG: hypothetical protein EZS28_028525 [Streblomastix strix]
MIFILALAFVSVVTSHQVDVTDCLDGKGKIIVNFANVEPWPIERNKNASVTLSYTIVQQVEEAECTQTIYKGKLPLRKDTYSICDLTPCPLMPGNQTATRDIEVPNVVPPGDYRGEDKCHNRNKVDICCGSYNITVV